MSSDINLAPRPSFTISESWLSTETCLQIESLLTRLYHLLSVMNLPRKPPVIPVSLAQQTKELTITQVKHAMKTCQKWMSKFTPVVSLASVCVKLVEISANFVMEEKISQTSQPSTSDKLETIDDMNDDSVEYYLVETMHLIFMNLLVQHKELPVLPDLVIRFLFDKLSRGPAVRRIAAECLGDLSHSTVMLEHVVNLLMAKMSLVKTDTDEREFSLYQRVIRFLCFSSSEIIVTYLNSLCKFMQNIDRGVLKLEIAASLKVLLDNYYFSVPFEKGFVHDSQKYKKAPMGMMDSLLTIYRVIFKWAGKSKYSQATDCLVRIAVLLPIQMYQSIKSDLEALLMDLLEQNEKYYLTCYYRDINFEFIRVDMVALSAKISLILSVIFKSKVLIQDNEIKELILVLGKVHSHYFFTDIAINYLSKKGVSEIHQILILNTLASLAKSLPETAGSYDYSLGPMILPFITMSNSPELLCAAISTFPMIKHSNALKARETALIISKYLLSPNSSLTSCSLNSIHMFTLLSETNFEVVIYSLLKLLVNSFDLCDNIEVQMKLWNAVSFCYKSDISGVAIKEFLEATILLYMTSPEPAIRQLVMLAAPKSTLLFTSLCDASMDTGVFSSNLVQFAKQCSAESLDGIVSFASESIFSVIRTIDVENFPSENEFLLLMSNRLMFACMVMKQPRNLQGSITLDDFNRKLVSFEQGENDFPRVSSVRSSNDRIVFFFTMLITLLRISNNKHAKLANTIIDALTLLPKETVPVLQSVIKQEEPSDVAKHPFLLKLLENIYDDSSLLEEPEDPILGLLEYWLDASIVIIPIKSKISVLKLLNRILISKVQTPVSVTTFFDFIISLIPKELYAVFESSKLMFALENNFPNSLSDFPVVFKLRENCLKKLSTQNVSIEDIELLESCQIQCVASLCLKVSDKEFLKRVFPLIHYFVSCGKHTQSYAGLALSNVLFNVPTLIQTFLRLSAPENHVFDDDFKSPNNLELLPCKFQTALHGVCALYVSTALDGLTHSYILGSLYLSAIRDCLKNSPDFLTLSKYSIGSLIPHIMIHLCSKRKETRVAAWDIFHAISSIFKSKFNASVEVPRVNFDGYSIAMFNSVKDFSASLAETVRDKFRNEIFSEIDLMMLYLCDRSSEILLNLMIPWIHNSNAVTDIFMSKLFSISIACVNRALTSSLVLSLWTEVSNDNLLAVIDFLLSNLAKNLGNPIIVSLTRSILHCFRECDIVTDRLIAKLRNITNVLPVLPEQFMDFVISKPEIFCVATVTSIEQAAYSMLVSFALKGVLGKALPLLLQYSVVFFEKLEESLFLWDWIQKQTNVVKSSDVKIESLEQIILKKASTPLELPISTLTPTEVLLENVKQYDVKLYICWSDLCLIWATHSRDASFSVKLIKLYGQFNTFPSSKTLAQFLLNIYLAIDDEEFEKIEYILKFFENNCEKVSKVMWQLLARCCISLLPYSIVFDHAVVLLIKLFEFESNCSDLLPLLYYLGSDRSKVESVNNNSKCSIPFDMCISEILLKGAYSVTSISQTVKLASLFQVLFCSSVDELAAFPPNQLLLFTMTCHIILCVCDSSRRCSVFFLSAVAKYSELSLAFYKYETDVAKVEDFDRKMSPTSMLPATMVTPINKLIDSYFDGLKSCSASNSFGYIFSLLCNLLSNGHHSWNCAILCMLNSALRYYGPSEKIFTELCEQFSRLYLESNSDICNLIETVTEKMVLHVKFPSRKDKSVLFNFTGVANLSSRDYVAKNVKNEKEISLACFDNHLLALFSVFSNEFDDASLSDPGVLEAPTKNEFVTKLELPCQPPLNCSSRLAEYETKSSVDSKIVSASISVPLVSQDQNVESNNPFDDDVVEKVPESSDVKLSDNFKVDSTSTFDKSSVQNGPHQPITPINPFDDSSNETLVKVSTNPFDDETPNVSTNPFD